MKITSFEPFWLMKNGIINSYPSLQRNENCDVLVIGSGITGSLIAHALLKKGYDVILTDKRHVATGSTSATTSMLQYEIDVPLHRLRKKIGQNDADCSYHACKEAITTLGAIVQEIDSNCGFEYKDSLYLAENESDITELKEEFFARKGAGFSVSWLESKEISDLYGIHAPGGILSRHGGSVDAYLLTHDLLAYNVKKGLRIYDHTHILTTRNEISGCTCNTSSGFSISARYVVFCTGYETQKLLKQHVVTLLSTYACVSEQHIPINNLLKNTLVWDTGNPYSYMRTTDDGRLLMGGEDELFKAPWLRDALMQRKQKKLEEKVEKLLPELPFITDFCWAGTFGITQDGLPYIGQHPDYKNCFFVLGFGGNGITFSVSGMQIITDLLKGIPNRLASIFCFNR